MALFYLDTLLFSFEATQIKPVGTIDPVNQRKYEQRSLPAGAAVDDSHQADSSSTDQIIRKRPEITFRPYSPAGFSLRQRNHQRNRHRVREEEHQCRNHKQNGLVWS